MHVGNSKDISYVYVVFLRANASPGNVRMPHKDHRMVYPFPRFLQGLLIHNHLVVFRSSLGSLYPAHQQNSGSFKNTFTHFNHPLQSCFSSVGTMGRETGIFLVCRFVFLRNCLFFRHGSLVISICQTTPSTRRGRCRSVCSEVYIIHPLSIYADCRNPIRFPPSNIQHNTLEHVVATQT